MDALIDSISQQTDRRVEHAIFGNRDATEIAEDIVTWCVDHVGSPESLIFYRRSSGIAVALTLVGGEEVVIKISQPHIGKARLDASRAAQRSLHATGFPVPALLVAPTALGAGHAAAEAYVSSERVDVHDSNIRRELAQGLGQLITTLAHVDLLADPEVADGLWQSTQPRGLWPVPHDPRFDFVSTAQGAGWIDQVASTAQQTLRASRATDCVAHLDWRVENVAFRNGQLAGIYDIDSIGKAPEAVAVGQSSAAFTTDWSIGHSTMPTVAEMQEFVADYESSRGASFGAADHSLIEAANLIVVAYGSRCEHSDRVLHPELAPPEGTGWAALLRERIHHPLSSASGTQRRR